MLSLNKTACTVFRFPYNFIIDQDSINNSFLVLWQLSIFRVSERIFYLSSNLATIIPFFHFSLLTTLNCSFSSNKFCKISSLCSHISFSTSSNPTILRLTRQDLSLRSLCLLQSRSLSKEATESLANKSQVDTALDMADKNKENKKPSKVWFQLF